MDSGSYQDNKKQKNAGPQKRDYGCPCGKTYLSYPALFTHVKQKHNGKPPGKLIKPLKEKQRGRPKTNVELPEKQLSDEIINLEQTIERVLLNVKIDYNGLFQTCNGGRTCQQMASSFLEELSEVEEEAKKVLHCFLNEIKYRVDLKHGEKYWKEEKPSELIDLTNEICSKHHEVEKKFPVGRQTLIELLYVLFRWMYKNKWTDHKLVKKSPQNNI